MKTWLIKYRNNSTIITCATTITKALQNINVNNDDICSIEEIKQ